MVTDIKFLNSSWLSIACIYRSPDGCIRTFLEHFEILIHTLKKKDKPLIICGDFNINFLSSDNIISEFRSLLQSYNLVETIGTPTRVTATTGTCLDQIIIDNEHYPFTVQNINLGISDHNAIFIHIQIDKDINPKFNKSISYRRIFNEDNINYFKSMIQKENWHDVINKTEVDAKSLEFLNIVKHYFDIAFPIKKIVTSHKHYKKSNCTTKGIITSCKRKREMAS